MQFFLDEITSDLRLTLSLSHDATPAGTYVSADDRMNQIDNALLKAEPQDEVVETVTITGRTDSKLYAILNSLKTLVVPESIVKKKVGNQFGEQVDLIDFDISRFINEQIRISGTDITGVITLYEDVRKEYTLYSDTEFPIKYVDFPDGTTTFSFSKIAEKVNGDQPLLNKFLGLVEEPKIESSVFIERGTVNVYEPFTKLKKVKSLNEMTKFGFGYFKMNKQGFNF